MDWRDLNSFITIAREKSISKASHTLHLSQSAMTIRLKRLEDELRIKLLERDWKGVTLTKEGETILYFATRALIEMNAMKGGKGTPARDDAVTAVKDTMIVGSTLPLGGTIFPHIVKRLMDQNIHLKFDLMSEHYKVILDLVALGEVDLGIVPYLDGRSDIMARPVLKDEMVLLAPRKYEFFSLQDPDSLDLLLRQPFYVLHDSLPSRKNQNSVLLRLLGRMPDDLRMINYSQVMIALISNGIGFTLLPASFIYETMCLFREMHSPDRLPERLVHPMVPFAVHRLGDQFPSRTIHLIYPHDSRHVEMITKIAEQFPDADG